MLTCKIVNWLGKVKEMYVNLYKINTKDVKY